MQYFVDYYRCRNKYGENYKPCTFFKFGYQDMCFEDDIQRWEEQVENCVVVFVIMNFGIFSIVKINDCYRYISTLVVFVLNRMLYKLNNIRKMKSDIKYYLYWDLIFLDLLTVAKTFNLKFIIDKDPVIILNATYKRNNSINSINNDINKSLILTHFPPTDIIEKLLEN